MSTHQSMSPQLDLLRTIAIFLVYADHFNWLGSEQWFTRIHRYGWMGVDLFFVLSGFLIASQLLKELSAEGTIRLTDFYIRRGMRIWPNYLAVLLIYFTFPAFIEREALPPFWKFLTFTQNFYVEAGQRGFSHAWSLCVEEHFYLALPLVLIILNKRGSFRKSLGVFLALLVGGLLLRSVLWHHFSSAPGGLGYAYFREIYYPSYCRLDGLAIGVSIASFMRLRASAWQRILEYANWILVAGLLLLFFGSIVCYERTSLITSTIGFPIVDLGFGCLVFAAISPSGIFAKIEIPGSRIGATLAFAFYLTHKQILHLSRDWIVELGFATDSISYLIAMTTLCLLGAAVLHLMVERPCLRLRDRVLDGRRRNREASVDELAVIA